MTQREEQSPEELQLPADLESDLSQAIRSALRDIGVPGALGADVIKILDRIAPVINRHFELKSVVHECCVEAQRLKVEWHKFDTDDPSTWPSDEGHYWIAWRDTQFGTDHSGGVPHWWGNAQQWSNVTHWQEVVLPSLLTEGEE
jgi:hypothetical protein